MRGSLCLLFERYRAAYFRVGGGLGESLAVFFAHGGLSYPHWYRKSQIQKLKLWMLWAAKIEVVKVATTIFAEIAEIEVVAIVPNLPNMK